MMAKTTKRTLAILLSVILLLAGFGLTAFAAGVDDGMGYAVAKDGVTYLGELKTNGAVTYIDYKAADGGEETFKEITKVNTNAEYDDTTDICDLVYLVLYPADINLDDVVNEKDLATLRMFLMEQNN